MHPPDDVLEGSEKRKLVLAGRGVEIGLLDFGGDGPIALLHHANGFCKETLALVARGLRPHYHVVSMDARGHGDSSRPEGPEAYAWRHFAADLRAVAEALVADHGGARVALGLGHSFGGTSLLRAAADAPGLFERIVLVDPVTPPPPAQTASQREGHAIELVERARRRRSDWPSHAEARAWFAERALFSDWLPEALDLYVHHGLRERSDGSVELKCPGQVEATVFSGGGAVDVAASAQGALVPALLLWASRGNFPRPFYEAIAASMQNAHVETLEAGHLVPMEEPELVVDSALRFAAKGQPA